MPDFLKVNFLSHYSQNTNTKMQIVYFKHRYLENGRRKKPQI